MSRRLSLLSVAAFCACASSASATITMTFGTLVGGNLASNFANAGGTPTTGMNWGIVVDTGGGGGAFSLDSYTSFNISSGGFLSTASGLTDDYFFPAASATIDTSGFFESGGAPGGPGSIQQISSVPFGGATNIAASQRFALIWFSTNSAATGDSYGFFTDVSFTIPPDGQSVDRSAVFNGADPVRPANHTIAAVPEPSSLLFLAAGTALLLRRRIRR